MAHNLTQIFARLIVACVLLPAGMHDIFGRELFDHDAAQRIESLGTPAQAFEKVVEKATLASLQSGEEGDEPAQENSQPSEGDGVSFRALSRMALSLDDLHVPQPLLVAWIAASLELIGGGAILLGFFTRLLSLPLACIGFIHLWKDTWPQLGGTMPWEWSPAESTTVAAWMAVALLCITLFLLGPGVPSLDSLMRGKPHRKSSASAAPTA